MRIQTARLELIPATAASIRSEMEDPAALAALLGASVPTNWPPATLADALPWFLRKLEATPVPQIGWLCWYALAVSDEHESPTLVASGGFLGPPRRDTIEVDTSAAPREGTVELGYAVLPQFQGQGYGTEMVGALVGWALEQPGVRRIVTDTSPHNTPSLRLLHRLGFTEIGRTGGEPGLTQFQRITPGMSEEPECG